MLEERQGARFHRVWLGTQSIPEFLLERLQEDGAEVLTLPHDRPWEAPASGELVLLAPAETKDDAGCDAFLLTARLKDPGAPRVTVALFCAEADRELIEPIARFCVADAVVTFDSIDPDTADDALETLYSLLERPAPRDSVDVLLARLEGKLGDDARRLADRVISGLSHEREQSFVASVTDPETGLFEGPFMAFKLEEEFKRSWRFRTPLAVLLLDLPRCRELGDDRTRILGEVAGVFLNECRDIDVLGRYDDTSFLLLLPNTGETGAKVLATRILRYLQSQIASPIPLEPAVAIVTVPKTGIARKDDLLDLARLTLMAAWAGEGDDRVKVAV